MAYEFVRFSLSENQPRFWKIVAATVALILVICFLVVKLSPEPPEDQAARSHAVSEYKRAQSELKEAQGHLDSLKAMKASGKTTAPWGSKDIQIDNAMRLGGASVELLKHRVSAEQITLNDLDEKRAHGESENFKTGGIVSSIVGLILGCVIWLIKSNRATYQAAKADLVKRGHSPDFQVGSALIDSKSKIIAFVNLGAKTYDLYGTRDILGWEHQWVNKTEVSTNAWGDRARSSSSAVDNVLAFKTNNPAKPLYKVKLASHREGEEWMARLGAIINS